MRERARTRRRRVGAWIVAASLGGVFGLGAGCGGDSSMDPAPRPPPPPVPPPPPANQAPERVGTLPSAEVEVGEHVVLQVSSYFRDPDGDALAYDARSGDEDVATVSTSAAEVTITAVAAGTTTLTVTATDPGGLSVAQSADIVVPRPGQAPTVTDTIPALTVAVGVARRLDLSAYFSDEDGDSLAYAAESSDTSVAAVSVAGAELTVQGVAAGEATLTVTASDPSGLMVSQTASVAVVAGQAPVVTDTIPTQFLKLGAVATIDLSAYFSDPDGDSLAYAAESSDTLVATVSVSGREVAITAVSAGGATLTITAADPLGLAATQRVPVISRANRAPEATEPLPALDITVNDTVRLDASDHFVDPDGDSLSYAAEAGDASVATVSLSGMEITVTGVSVGSTTLTVVARDDPGLVAEQTSAITVHPNRAPAIAQRIAPLSLLPEEAFSLNMLLHFNDPDGDSLAYVAASSDESVAGVSLDGARVTVTGRNVGEATVTVRATDPGGLSATQQFVATVENASEVTLREDFDGDELAGRWTILDAETSVADGIVRVESTLPGLPGELRSGVPDLATSAELRMKLAFGTTENTGVAVLLWMHHARYLLVGLDLGYGIHVGEDDTNHRLRILDLAADADGEWEFVPGTHGVSDAIPENPDEFFEAELTIKNQRARAWIDGVELFDIEWPDRFPSTWQFISLWVYPVDEAGAGVVGLFDWLEIKGRKG